MASWNSEQVSRRFRRDLADRGGALLERPDAFLSAQGRLPQRRPGLAGLPALVELALRGGYWVLDQPSN